MYNNDLKNLRIIRYRRKSTEGEDRQIASLADQDIELDGLNTSLCISESQIFDNVAESRSAKKPGRIDFNNRVLKLIEKGQANAIQAWQPNRLSRNAIDTAALINLMDEGKLRALITKQQIYWNTPNDKFLLALACGQAKLENDNKGIDVRRGLAGKIRKGWRPGVAPIGYLNDKTKEPGDRDIVVDPETFPLVRQVWDLLLTGKYSVRQIRNIANTQLMLRTRKTKRQGGKALSESHVYRIFRAPFYYGWYWWKNQETGQSELRQGKHKPMITEAEYELGQQMLGHTPRPQPKTHHFAYTALMTCGECHSAITAEEKWQMICGICKTKFASQGKERCPTCRTKLKDISEKKVLHYVYYHCTKHKGFCSQKGIRVENLEAQSDRFLMAFNIGEKYMRWALNTLRDKVQDELGTQTQCDTNLTRERTRVKDELTELTRFIIKQENAGWTLMSKEDALAAKHRLMEELKNIEENQKHNNDRAGKGFDSSIQAFEYACRARFWLREGTVQQKREICAALGSNLTLKDGILTVMLAYPLPEIATMIDNAPEMAAWFEPKTLVGFARGVERFEKTIPYLLPGSDSNARIRMLPEDQSYWEARLGQRPLRIAELQFLQSGV